jgi:hypothetical protein
LVLIHQALVIKLAFPINTVQQYYFHFLYLNRSSHTISVDLLGRLSRFFFYEFYIQMITKQETGVLIFLVLILWLKELIKITWLNFNFMYLIMLKRKIFYSLRNLVRAGAFTDDINFYFRFRHYIITHMI